MNEKTFALKNLTFEELQRLYDAVSDMSISDSVDVKMFDKIQEAYIDAKNDISQI
jgi:hypothetical protein